MIEKNAPPTQGGSCVLTSDEPDQWFALELDATARHLRWSDWNRGFIHLIVGLSHGWPPRQIDILQTFLPHVLGGHAR